MDESVQKEMEAKKIRYQHLYESATPFERLRMSFRAFRVSMILSFPILIPLFVGGLLFTVLFTIGTLFLTPEYSEILYWICSGIMALVVLPWAWRNIKFVGFVEDHLDSNKDEDAEKRGK